MISTRDYFGPWLDHEDATPLCKASADVMLEKVNALLAEAEAHGVELHINPKTATFVSGEAYGGFRPKDCPIGAPHSAHKDARAVDVYDPHGDLDRWITDARLTSHGLYREAPACTSTWCHLQDRPTAARTFQP